MGIAEPRICSRPVLANKVYDTLAQMGVLDEELVDESADPYISDGLLHDFGSGTVICLIGLQSHLDVLIHQRVSVADHSNSGS